MKVKEKVLHNCFHCGDECGTSIEVEHKYFCCHGCRTVFELLNESGFSDYYNIESTPGIKLKNWTNQDYTYLDQPEISSPLIEFEEGTHSTIRLSLPQIHCSSCIWLLEKLPALCKGVLNCRVNFVQKEARIVYDNEQTSFGEIAKVLHSIGYAPHINLDSAQSSTDNGLKQESLRLGVAAFCFGNIMLFSFPEYLPGDAPVDEFRDYFAFLNILLSLPVLLYAARPYFSSAWKGLINKSLNIDVPITLGAITLFVKSLFDIVLDIGPGYLDSLSGLIFFLLIGRWFQAKSYRSLSFDRNYKSFFPIAVVKKENGNSEFVSIEKIAPGDEIHIKSGELIPCDSILLSEEASFDFSFITGEALLVSKKKGDVIKGGARLMGKSVDLVVEKKVDQGYLTRLWNDSNEKKNNHSIQALVDVLSKYFTIGLLIIALSTLLFWLFKDRSIALHAFTSVLIVACPCALALAVPFTYGSAMRWLGNLGMFLKNAQVTEQLASIENVVFDKTGTLSDQEQYSVEFIGPPLSREEMDMIVTVADNSTHPLSSAVSNSLLGNAEVAIDHWEEIAGQGIVAMCNDVEVRLGSASFTKVPEVQNENATAVYVSFNGIFRGKFNVKSLYRPGLKSMFKQLRRQWKLFLLSGDVDADRSRLETIFGQSNEMHFQQSPSDKKNFIERLSASSPSMMVGDGFNDSGAMKVADVGVAVADDIHRFSPSSDVIIQGNQLTMLPEILVYSRRAVNIVKLNFTVALLYNLVGLMLAVSGVLSPLYAAILMPVSSLTVVVIAFLLTFLFRPKKG